MEINQKRGGAMSGEKVLIVDDQIELLEIISDYLKRESFQVIHAQNGKEALEKFQQFAPQVVILDVMMPEIDGMEVCRRIRSKGTVPIIMVSAKSDDVDKIVALGLGADDYVTKPFSPGELMARIKAQLRRYLYLSQGVESEEMLQIKGLEIEPKAYTVKKNGRLIELTAKEFELLVFLAQNPMQVFSKEQLFQQIWGFQEFGDVNTVTVHIRKIREKIEDIPSEPRYIKTVWSVGYKFDGREHE